MGKQDVLRGRGQFGLVITRGRKVSVRLLRATYLVNERDGETVRFGVAIPKQTGNAVRRNRVRRLIREAIRLERDKLQSVLQQTRIRVDIVIQFRPAVVPPLRQLSLQHLKPEVQRIFETIVTRISL